MATQITNQLSTAKKTTIGTYLNGDAVKGMLTKSLGSEKAMQKFTSSVLAAVSGNPDLQKCDASTVVSAGMLANALDLSLSPSLGFAYLVPFEDKKNNRTVATFIPGYKGYIQLAIRSGYYSDIDVVEIKDGEYLGKDKSTGKAKFEFIEDDDEWEKRKTVGYMAYFEYTNGFRKVLYWSKEKMLRHADTYSKAFFKDATPNARVPRVSFSDYEAGKVPKGDEWKYSSYWYKDFAGMAKKTMLRQLLSKWGILSVEMQSAIENENELDEAGKTTAFESVTDDFFGNDEGLSKPGEEEVTVKEEAEKKTARKKKPAEVINDDADGTDPFEI